MKLEYQRAPTAAEVGYCRCTFGTESRWRKNTATPPENERENVFVLCTTAAATIMYSILYSSVCRAQSVLFFFARTRIRFLPLSRYLAAAAEEQSDLLAELRLLFSLSHGKTTCHGKICGCDYRFQENQNKLYHKVCYVRRWHGATTNIHCVRLIESSC